MIMNSVLNRKESNARRRLTNEKKKKKRQESEGFLSLLFLK